MADFELQVFVTYHQFLLERKLRPLSNSSTFFRLAFYPILFCKVDLSSTGQKVRQSMKRVINTLVEYICSSVKAVQEFCSKRSSLKSFSRLHFRRNTCEFNTDFFFFLKIPTKKCITHQNCALRIKFFARLSANRSLHHKRFC